MGIKFSSVQAHTKFSISIRVVERSPHGGRAAPRIMTLHGGSLDQGVGEPDGVDCLWAPGLRLDCLRAPPGPSRPHGVRWISDRQKLCDTFMKLRAGCPGWHLGSFQPEDMGSRV